MKACSLFFFSPSISALTAHPLHLLYGELQLKCILGDAGLLYNLAAGFHSCLSATHKTCTHTHTQRMPSGTERIPCVFDRKKNTRVTPQQHITYTASKTKCISCPCTLSLLFSRNIGVIQKPLAYLSIPFSLLFLPLFRCRFFPTQNSISKLVPVR